MLFTKQQAREFEGLRSKFGDASILEEMANQKPEKKTVIDSLRQSGFADSDIVSEFLKQKSTWKLPSTQWQGMTPQVQKSYQQRYNIEIVPVGKPQQAIPVQPEQKQSGLDWWVEHVSDPVLGAVEKIDKPMLGVAQSMTAKRRQLFHLVPKATDLQNAVASTDYGKISRWYQDGKIPSIDQIRSQLEPQEADLLINELNRATKGKIFSDQGTAFSRGVLVPAEGKSAIGKLGASVYNVIQSALSPEQVLVPSQLAINLATLGVGGRVATGLFDSTIKKGLTDTVKAGTMTPEAAKQVFTATKYYAQNSTAATLKAVLRGDIPAPKVPGQEFSKSAQQYAKATGQKGVNILARKPFMEQELKSQFPKPEQNLEEAIPRTPEQYYDLDKRASQYAQVEKERRLRGLLAETKIRKKVSQEKQFREERQKFIEQESKPKPIPPGVRTQIEKIRAKFNADLMKKYDEAQIAEAQKGADSAITQLGSDWVRKMNSVLSKKTSATNALNELRVLHNLTDINATDQAILDAMKAKFIIRRDIIKSMGRGSVKFSETGEPILDIPVDFEMPINKVPPQEAPVQQTIETPPTIQTGRNVDIDTLTQDVSNALGYGGEKNNNVLKAVSEIQAKAKEQDYTWSETIEQMTQDGSLLKYKKAPGTTIETLPAQKAVEIALRNKRTSQAMPTEEQATPEAPASVPNAPESPTGAGVSPAKEPYEMTRREFENYDQNPYALGVDSNAVEIQNKWLEETKRLTGKRSGKEILEAGDKYGGHIQHRWIIENALKEGKQVPDNVLADYPDLAKTVQKEGVESKGTSEPNVLNDAIDKYFAKKEAELDKKARKLGIDPDKVREESRQGRKVVSIESRNPDGRTKYKLANGEFLTIREDFKVGDIAEWGGKKTTATEPQVTTPKETTKPADMTDAELQDIINQSKDDYVRRNFPPDIKKVYDNPISKGTMNISSYPKKPTIPEAPKVSPEESINATLEGSFPTQRVNPNEIAVRATDMQFKRMDDAATGTNKEEMLSGEWDEIKGGNLLLWQPEDPALYGLANGAKYIVVNGHHRLKLAKENNVTAIDVKILKENDPSAPNGQGYSFEDAYNKGAEINIAEGRGSVYDQVTFIRNQRRIYGENGKTYTKTGASPKERKAYTIATNSEDNTFDAFTSRAISSDQAEIIAKTAPNDYDTQAIGIRLAKTGKTGVDLETNMQALKMIQLDNKLESSQLDMFGGADNELFKRADDIAGIVKGIKRDISDRILSVKGILKRPKQAGEMGAQLKDAYATEQEVKRLEAELDRWDRWYEEAPDSEIRQRIDKELRDKNLADTSQFTMDLGAKVESKVAPPEGMTDEEIAQIQKDIKEKGKAIPPEDLIKQFMDRKGYTREEAIEDIRKHGGFASFGFKQKPSLIENPDPTNDAAMERFRNAQKIMRNIPDETKPFAQIMSELYSEVVDKRWALKLYRKYAEKTNPQGVKVLPGKDPFLLATRYHGIGGIIRSKLEWKTTRVNYTGNLEKTGEGLVQALKPISGSSKQLEDFEDFLTAQTIIEDSMYGYSNQKATVEASEYVNAMISKYGKNYDKFFKVAEDARDWYVRATIDPLHEAGIMSDETYKGLLEKREFWSPMKRYIEGTYDANGKQIKEGLMDSVAMPARGDIFQPKGKLIHKRVGSEKPQIPALEGILTNVYRINNFVERHNVAKAVVDLRDMSPEMRDLIVPVMDPQFDTNFAGRNIISVFKNGVRKYYQVPDDLYKALTHLDLVSVNLAKHILSMPARILRTGAIDSPEFFLRNIFFRDPISAFILAKHSLSLPNFARGFADVIGKSEMYWEMMASGGDSAMLVSLDRMSSRFRLKELSSSKSLREKTHGMLVESEMSKPQKLAIGTKNVVRHPLDALQKLSELSEKPTRMGVYRGAKKAGEPDIVAMYEYRDIPDFSIKGQAEIVNTINEMVPFWRASVRGLDKTGRSFIERPKKTILRGLLAISAPTLAFFVLNKVFNRHKFDQYTQEDKDKYWFIPTGEGNEDIRLQKPFDVGAIFSVPLEHTLEYIDKRDSHAMEALYETMFSMGKQLNPGMIIPQVIKPPLEIWSNKNFYTGGPIIPASLKDEIPQDQFQPYSSETAKMIGNFIKVSPLRIDHAINGYFASLGRYFVKGLDEIIKGGQKSAGTYIPRPKGTLGTAPVVRAYVAMKPEGTLANSVTELYRLLNKTTAEQNHLETLTKQYGGKPKEAIAFVKKHPEVVFHNQLYSSSKLISQARKAKMVIYNDPKMNPEEKRQKIDAADRLMTMIADITTIIVNTATKHEKRPYFIPSYNVEKEPTAPATAPATQERSGYRTEP